MRGFKSENLLIGALAAILLLTGCQQNVVYQRSLADLNQKAQAMMQAGDYAGAVSRLEAAHDLQPDEPNTMYNLAVAYQMNGNYDQAAELFNKLLEKKSMDESEIHKSLGIIYEAKADKLVFEAKSGEEGTESGEGESAKPDPAELVRREQEATQVYQLALEHYKKALETGVKSPAEVETQIRALEARLEQPDEAATR